MLQNLAEESLRPLLKSQQGVVGTCVSVDPTSVRMWAQKKYREEYTGKCNLIIYAKNNHANAPPNKPCALSPTCSPEKHVPDYLEKAGAVYSSVKH